MPVFSLGDIKQNSPISFQSGQEDRFLCPSCGNSKPKNKEHCSFSANRNTGAFKCHRCGITGVLKEHWKKQTQKKDNKQYRTLAQIKKEESLTEDDEGRINDAESIFNKLSGIDSDCFGYLAQRALNRPLVDDLGLRLLVNNGNKNIVFPILSVSGDLVGLNIRGIHGSFKQIRGSIKHGFYSTPEALKSEYVAITEAPIDAISLYSFGIPAIALCGKVMHAGLKKELQKAINGKSRKIYIALDNDDAGKEASQKINDSLYISTIKTIPPQKFKDWNEWLVSDYFGLFDFLLENFPELKKQWEDKERASLKAEPSDNEPKKPANWNTIEKDINSIGYCLIDSKTLGERVYLLKNKSTPTPNDNYARYTIDELEHITTNAGDLTKETLKKTHEVKTMFEGVIVPNIKRHV